MVATAQREVVTRAFGFPNEDTLSCPPIADFARRWLADRAVIVDPFARNSHWATLYSNDLNPATRARFHMHAWLFLWMLARQKVCADAVIFDPPFSPTQVKRVYDSIGVKADRRDTQTARLKRVCRWLIRRISGPGTVVLSFGWNTQGMGREWNLEELLICDHGGDHNATLCRAETLPRLCP
jgi:hypothetical protein